MMLLDDDLSQDDMWRQPSLRMVAARRVQASRSVQPIGASFRHAPVATVLSRTYSAPSGGPPQDKKPPSSFASWASQVSFERGGTGQYLLLGAGALALYGVSTALMDTVVAFMSMKPIEMGMYGFYSGMGTAFLGSGGAWWAHRSIRIEPEPVYAKAFKAVYQNKDSYNALGRGRVKNVTDLKAYRTEQGRFKIGEGNKLVWASPKAYLVFQVESNAGEGGVVVAEGTRHGFRTELTYARLDTPSKRVVIKGKEERHAKLDEMAGLVAFPRLAG